MHTGPLVGLYIAIRCTAGSKACFHAHSGCSVKSSCPVKYPIVIFLLHRVFYRGVNADHNVPASWETHWVQIFPAHIGGLSPQLSYGLALTFSVVLMMPMHRLLHYLTLIGLSQALSTANQLLKKDGWAVVKALKALAMARLGKDQATVLAATQEVWPGVVHRRSIESIYSQYQ